MSNDNRDNETKGRNWDQLTSGTTSAATMGAGATGDVAAKAEGKDSGRSEQSAAGQPPNVQQAGRTDDLLAGGSSQEQGDTGFQGKAPSKGNEGSQSAAGAGSRQSAPEQGRDPK